MAFIYTIYNKCIAHVTKIAKTRLDTFFVSDSILYEILQITSIMDDIIPD